MRPRRYPLSSIDLHTFLIDRLRQNFAALQALAAAAEMFSEDLHVAYLANHRSGTQRTALASHAGGSLAPSRSRSPGTGSSGVVILAELCVSGRWRAGAPGRSDGLKRRPNQIFDIAYYPLRFP